MSDTIATRPVGPEEVPKLSSNILSAWGKDTTSEHPMDVNGMGVGGSGMAALPPPPLDLDNNKIDKVGAVAAIPGISLENSETTPSNSNISHDRDNNLTEEEINDLINENNDNLTEDEIDDIIDDIIDDSNDNLTEEELQDILDEIANGAEAETLYETYNVKYLKLVQALTDLSSSDIHDPDSVQAILDRAFAEAEGMELALDGLMVLLDGTEVEGINLNDLKESIEGLKRLLTSIGAVIQMVSFNEDAWDQFLALYLSLEGFDVLVQSVPRFLDQHVYPESGNLENVLFKRETIDGREWATHDLEALDAGQNALSSIQMQKTSVESLFKDIGLDGAGEPTSPDYQTLHQILNSMAVETQSLYELVQTSQNEVEGGNFPGINLGLISSTLNFFQESYSYIDQLQGSLESEGLADESLSGSDFDPDAAVPFDPVVQTNGIDILLPADQRGTVDAETTIQPKTEHGREHMEVMAMIANGTIDLPKLVGTLAGTEAAEQIHYLGDDAGTFIQQILDEHGLTSEVILADFHNELSSSDSTPTDGGENNLRSLNKKSHKGIGHWFHQLEKAGEKIAEKTLKKFFGLIGSRGEDVYNWLKNEGKALEKIAKDPRGFMHHLADAVGTGFKNFGTHFGQHVQGALIQWLTGSITSAGITLPIEFTGPSMFQLTTEVLGITYDDVKDRLINHYGISEEVVNTAEAGAGLLQTLKNEGMIGLWDEIQQFGQEILGQIEGELKDWAEIQLIEGGVEKLLEAVVPGAGLFEAAKEIYEFITWMMDQAKQLANLIDSITQSMTDIANGNTGNASATIEQALEDSISVVLDLVADLLGVNVAHSLSKGLESIHTFIWDKIDAGIKALSESLLGQSHSDSTLDQELEDLYEHIDTDEKINRLLERAGKESVQLGPETHHAEIRANDNETNPDEVISIGVASNFEDVLQIHEALIKEWSSSSTLTPEQQASKAFLEPLYIEILDAETQANIARHALAEEKESVGRVTRKRKRDEPNVDDNLKQYLDNAKATCDDAAEKMKSYIKNASVHFEDVLFNLGIREAGKNLGFKGDGNILDYYRTGDTQEEAIPILWYKPRASDYPSISLNGQTVRSNGKITIPGKDQSGQDKDYQFGVSASNQVGVGTTFKKGVSKFKDRGEQKHLNKVINESGAKVGDTNYKDPMSLQKFDGDHVTDLSFGGKDQITNYWPLDWITNEAGRMFSKLYAVNYKKKEGGTYVGKMRTLEQLQGKWFKIKGFDVASQLNHKASDSQTEDAGKDSTSDGLS